MDARFCPQCGLALAERTATQTVTTDHPDAAQPRRERKLATTLFADLVGSTTLGETQDPEVVQALVARVFDRLSEEVRRHEGLAREVAGDALLGIFGVPSIHEDDAERAVRAALGMQTAMGALASDMSAEGHRDLALRIGIETGEVLVDLDRVRSERDRVVTGDAVNVAARLQQAAPPGGVLVGPGAYARTRHVIHYEELPPLALKGKSGAVPAWQALGSTPQARGIRAPLGFEAPLIGRDEELTLLTETLRRTVADRRPHLVTVIGAPGVGKSRLVRELRQHLDALPAGHVLRTGRCLAYGAVTYAALAEVLRADAGVREDDPAVDARAKLDARLAALAPRGTDPALRAALLPLVGGSEEVPSSREALFDAWRTYLELVARSAPLVLLLEDVHWADEGLLDFIEFLARWAESPILILCLARHDLLERRPGWAGGIANAATIVLEPLEASENARLIDALLSGALPAPLRDQVIAIAEGNPLFTEELVRMFLDRGLLRSVGGHYELAGSLDELRVPSSVQSVVAARLDGLPAPEKRAAQDAAVAGRVFWDAIVADLSRQEVPVTRDILRRLRVKAFVAARQPSTLAGAGEYTFRHALMRDAAYDSIPKRERAAKHLTVARWAESELASRSDDAVELLASHYENALRYEQEFGAPGGDRLAELRRSTYEHARRAGARARALHQRELGARWTRLAIDQARPLAIPARERARLALEYVTVATGYEASGIVHEVASEALELLHALADPAPGDRETEASIRALDAYLLYQLDRFEEARELLDDGLSRMGRQPSRGRALLLARRGWLAWRTGSADRAITDIERAVQEARASGNADVARWAIHDLGIARNMVDGGASGLDLLERSMSLAKAANDVPLLMRCYINIPGILLSGGGAAEQVTGLLDEGILLARRTMDRGSEGWIAWQYAEILEQHGRLREARAWVEHAIDMARRTADAQQLGTRKAGLAWHLAYAGQWDEARTVLQSADRDARPGREEQTRVYYEVFRAWDRWQSDPHAAVRQLADVLPGIRWEPVFGALFLIRTAVRVGAPEAIAVALRAVDEGRAAYPNPVHAEQVRWVHAMAEHDADGVLRCAERLKEMDALLYAAWAYADAALLLARAGASAEAAEVGANAQKLHDDIGLVPMLGPLPETRWSAAPFR